MTPWGQSAQDAGTDDNTSKKKNKLAPWTGSTATSDQPPGYYSSDYGPAVTADRTNAAPLMNGPFPAPVAAAPTSGGHGDSPPPYKNIHFRYRDAEQSSGMQHLDSYLVTSNAQETSAAPTGRDYTYAAPGEGTIVSADSKDITFTYGAVRGVPWYAPGPAVRDVPWHSSRPAVRDVAWYSPRPAVRDVAWHSPHPAVRGVPGHSSRPIRANR